MSRGEFVETLKRIGFHEADNLEGYDFDCMFSDKDLSPFLEVFCTLNENNVLTTEEIQEYSSLTEAELSEIEELQKSGYLETINTIEEKRKETYLLQEQLAQIENHNKTLEKQVDLFKKHGKNLLEEKETRQKLLLDSKRKFRLYEVNVIPQAESEFVSSLQSILKQVQDLESLIMQADVNESKIPTSYSFQAIVKEYLKAEEKILYCVKTFMQNNFQLLEKDYSLSFISCENEKNEELQKEASFLHTALKQKMMDKVIYEKEVKKIESIVKRFETVPSPTDFNCHSSQLRPKLGDALKLNEKLKKREEELSLYLLDAVSKHVDAQFSMVSLSVIAETSKLVQHAIEKMSLPMNTLLHQRARVEMLIASLREHGAELQNLKELIEHSLNQIKDEHLDFQERKVQIENKLTEVVQMQNREDPETSLYLSLYKILAMPGESGIQDVCNISLQDILQRTNKYFEASENFTKKHEENLRTTDLMEKSTASLDMLLTCTDKDYVNWHELRQSLNADLNVLDTKLVSLEGATAECHEELDQKQKVLDGSGNLRLARKLFMYALMNKEVFKKYIDDIKEAIENSQEYKPRS